MDFLDWLSSKIKSEGLTQSEFARRAGLSKSHVSLVLSGQRGVTLDFCAGVARVFRLEEIDVLKLAGLLPVREKRPDYKTQDFTSGFRQLTVAQQDFIISLIEFLISQKQKP